jgi:hypothetical protein
MDKEINLIFHNLGLRTYIEVDLCAECPRQDDKGCCGFYSPVFYPTDLAYLYLHQPEMIEKIFSFDHLTVLDHSVTVNNVPEGDSYRCKFHSKNGGCLPAFCLSGNWLVGGIFSAGVERIHGAAYRL